MNKRRIQSWFQPLLATSPLTWNLLGFLISYLLFFVLPVFFSSQDMQFPDYVPIAKHIGIDLEQMLSYSESWLIDKQTPYIGNNLYPPIASILFTPLLVVNFPSAYKIFTMVNIIFYILVTLVLPLSMVKERRLSPLLMLFFITGLFSYGFQFELERGQFNVIATFICFLAVWIYHHHYKYRYLAYLLFTISVQLKVFPFIFIVMFITDWHDWKNNIKRFMALAMVNFALLFILGIPVFVDFARAILAQTVHPYIWIGNHSIRAFVTLASNMASVHDWRWGLIQIALLAMTVACLCLIMLRAYRRRQNGINSHLLLACTIGALLIPSVSHDYTLSILAAPVAILSLDMSKEPIRPLRPYQRIIFPGMMLILSVAYSSTLFSYTNKPLSLANTSPALMTMLLAVTCISIMTSPRLNSQISETR